MPPPRARPARRCTAAVDRALGTRRHRISEGGRQPASAGAALRGAQAELQTAIDEFRDLVHGIRPPVLRHSGLARAIEAAAAWASTPIERVALPDVRPDDVAERRAYFVIREALNNAQGYAGAHLIRVRVQLRGDRLLAEVSDDAVGGATEQQDLRLQGLRDRVEAIGRHLRHPQRVRRRHADRCGNPARVMDRRRTSRPSDDH
jgi:signal transduction histidine kinase